MVLILDNFEQVMDAAAEVSSLVASSSVLKVVVTSRQALRVEGEREFPLHPLALPSPASETAEILATPAIELFVARARALRPGLVVGGEDAVHVAGICAAWTGFHSRSGSPRLGSRCYLLARLRCGWRRVSWRWGRGVGTRLYASEPLRARSSGAMSFWTETSRSSLVASGSSPGAGAWKRPRRYVTETIFHARHGLHVQRHAGPLADLGCLIQ